MKKNKNGFTMVELLAVIAVLGLLIAIATTAITYSLEREKKKTAKLSAKQYVTAVNDYNYISSQSDKIPGTKLACTLQSGTIYRCNATSVSNVIKDSISGTLPTQGTVDIDTSNYKVKSASLTISGLTVNYSNSTYSVN